MSNDPQEYFSDGISEDLMSALARFKALKVAARTSAFSFKGKNVDLREVGLALNVETVLEGSVRKSGEHLRITVELSDGRTGYQLWSETYDRELTDIFAIQDDITARIISALQLHLDGQETPPAPAQVDADVYPLVLRGRFHWNQRSPEGLASAAELLQEATRRAPQYAPAFSALADVYLSQYDYGLLSWDESTVRARAAATKALELDDDSAAANTSLAHILLHEWQWQAAEQHFQRAIELDPTYTLALHWYALCLTALGRTDEAVKAMQRAQQLDPLSVRINADLGMAFIAAGKYEEAVAQEGRALDLDPGGGWASMDPRHGAGATGPIRRGRTRHEGGAGVDVGVRGRQGLPRTPLRRIRQGSQVQGVAGRARQAGRRNRCRVLRGTRLRRPQ
jgi:adenylate cyclase